MTWLGQGLVQGNFMIAPDIWIFVKRKGERSCYMLFEQMDGLIEQR